MTKCFQWRRRATCYLLVIPGFFGACSTLHAQPAAPVATIEGWVGNHQAARSDHLRYAVWVDDISGKFQPPKQHAVLDQRNLRFVPHILTILAGTTVEFSNSDSLLHNVFSISPTKQFNLGLYPKGRLPTVLFDKPGVVAILCNVHPEMSAYIIVLQNPFFAVPDLDGHFVIRDVPAGSRTVHCWSEDGKSRERKVVVAQGLVNSVEF